MPHILNKITGAKFKDVKKQLGLDRASHAKQGMYLEHLWRNADNPNETFFLFRVEDLDKCKQFMKKVHTEALKKNPNIKLPEKIFLEE